MVVKFVALCSCISSSIVRKDGEPAGFVVGIGPGAFSLPSPALEH